MTEVMRRRRMGMAQFAVTWEADAAFASPLNLSERP